MIKLILSLLSVRHSLPKNSFKIIYFDSRKNIQSLKHFSFPEITNLLYKIRFNIVYLLLKSAVGAN